MKKKANPMSVDEFCTWMGWKDGMRLIPDKSHRQIEAKYNELWEAYLDLQGDIWKLKNPGKRPKGSRTGKFW